MAKVIHFSAFHLLRSNTPVKPPSSVSSVASSLSMRPPTPSTSVSLPYNRGSGSSGSLRPPSRASSGAMFTSSPGLPPPPLLVPAHSTAAGTVNNTFHCCYSLFHLFMGTQWLICTKCYKNKPNPDFLWWLSRFVWVCWGSFLLMNGSLITSALQIPHSL